MPEADVHRNVWVPGGRGKALYLAKSCLREQATKNDRKVSSAQPALSLDESHARRSIASPARTMFAPPPIQLTRAQIETAKLEAKAREEAKRQSAEASTSTISPSTKTKSPSPKRKNGLFARSSKIKVSSPIAQRLPQPSAERLSRESASIRDRQEEKVDNGQTLPVPFGEQPRRAPVPPKRPARPPSELFLPHVPGAFPVQQPLGVSLEQPRGPLPALPNDAGPRKSQNHRFARNATAARTQSTAEDNGLSAALVGLEVEDNGPSTLVVLPRSSTLPVLHGEVDDPAAGCLALAGDGTESTTDTVARTPVASGMQRLPAVQVCKVAKSSPAKPANSTCFKGGIMTADRPTVGPPRRATEGDLVFGSKTAPESQQVLDCRRKGETMNRLKDSGFFPVRGTAPRRSVPALNTHVKIPTHLSYLNKELPSTPDSILATPTEMYHVTPRHAKAEGKIRRSRVAKRSPLSQISSNPKAKSPRKRSLNEEVSPSRLAAIPELASTTENSPPDSEVTTPTARQIHLPGGSVLTVTPPEMTAWQRHVYLQGPIKLPKPAIMPRKNSVASLEPFQEVIDQVYQDALAIPRRRSDDAVVDDICDWLDEFGFEEVDFAGDRILVNNVEIDDVQEVDEMDQVDVERFSTPPVELDVSPIDKIVAKEVIQMSQPKQAHPIHMPPPVDNEQTLRARGIARLSQKHTIMTRAVEGRKESLTIPWAAEKAIQLTPMPEESMLEAAPEAKSTPAAAARREGEELTGPMFGQGSPDDVEEMDAQSTWVAVLPQKHQDLSTSQIRNPVKKMRRLMATASTIL